MVGSPPQLGAHPTRPGGSPRSRTGSPFSSSASAHGDERRPRKRKGRILSVLRQQYAVELEHSDPDQQQRALVSRKPKPRLSVHSPGWVLSRAEMRWALNHHLINLAWKTIDAISFPIWIDMSSALDELRASLAGGTPSAATEVQVAALICVAARRSDHSAITGISRSVPDQPSGSTQLATTALGRRREQACAALLERAIGMAEQSGAFERASRDSIHTLSLLRIATLTSAPRHRVMIPIVDSLRAHYLAGAGAVSPDSVIASDAGSALIFGRPLALSEREMDELGWPAVDVSAVRRKLEGLSFGSRLDEQMMLDLRGYVIHITRKMAHYTTRGWSLDPDCSLPLPARPVFDELESLAAAVEKAMHVFRLMGPPKLPVLVRHLKHNNQLTRVAVFFQSSIVNLARQLVMARVDPDADQILREAEVRYLRWLQAFVGTLSCGNEYEQDDILSQAVIVDGLEMLPEWLDLAIRGARESAAGEGPLAEAGFEWGDLRRLHALLKISAAVFASSAAHEQALATELSVLDLAGGAGAVKAADDSVAESMLLSALDEMLAG